MTPQQALDVLSQATQPNVQLSRSDYVMVEQALSVIHQMIEQLPKELKTASDPKAASK